MIQYETCPKCRIRKMEAWEIMCKSCFKAGKMDEQIIDEDDIEWNDFSERDD